jgi:hypothetical protein
MVRETGQARQLNEQAQSMRAAPHVPVIITRGKFPAPMRESKGNKKELAEWLLHESRLDR